MEKLILHIYEPGKSKSEQTVILRFSQLQTAQRLMPIKLKESLERVGIDINVLGQLSGKNFSKGVLIEVESNQT